MRSLVLALVAMLVVTGCGAAVETDEAETRGMSAEERVAETPPERQGGPPPMLAAPGVEPQEDPLFIHPEDNALRAALEPLVSELLDAGHDVRFRGHCSWNVRCVDVFWEGIVLPERSRLACPEDVPLRRELSVDRSLTGEALAAAIRLQLGRALASPFTARAECVRTERAFFGAGGSSD